MKSYNLERGAFVVLQRSDVSLVSEEGRDPLDEVVLTNKSLVLAVTVPDGAFRTARYLKRLPLEQALDDLGVPRTAVTKVDNSYVLNVAFSDETVSLCFAGGSAGAARRWEQAISSAAVGDLDSIGADGETADMLGDLLEEAKGTFGALFGGTGHPRKKAELPERPMTVTKRCMGCHAPIVGRKGSVVTCGYCDTKQTL